MVLIRLHVSLHRFVLSLHRSQHAKDAKLMTSIHNEFKQLRPQNQLSFSYVKSRLTKQARLSDQLSFSGF